MLPTMSTRLVFIACTIAVSEKWNVRCHNILSLFVNTDVDEDELMVLKGELVGMMIQIASQTYRKYITADKQEPPFCTSNCRKLSMG